MLRSWKLGSLFGIGIYIHWSLFLLIGYVFYSNWSLGGLEMARYGVTVMLAVLGCVVLHELGHALAARYYGIPTRDITLYPIGGVARLERMSERPLEEFWIAVAGPAVNLVIFILLLPLVLIWEVPAMLAATDAAEIGTHIFLFHLALANLVLLGFNLLPAFPMDGGRVLRAILTPSLGRLRATEIAANLGSVFAFLFATVLAMWLRSPMPVLVGIFILVVGRLELAMVRRQASRRRGELLEALPVHEDEVIDVAPAPLDPLFSGTTWDATTRAWVVWRNGRPVHTYWVD
jgi:Zn-dependent protease